MAATEPSNWATVGPIQHTVFKPTKYESSLEQVYVDVYAEKYSKDNLQVMQLYGRLKNKTQKQSILLSGIKH